MEVSPKETFTRFQLAALWISFCFIQFHTISMICMDFRGPRFENLRAGSCLQRNLYSISAGCFFMHLHAFHAFYAFHAFSWDFMRLHWFQCISGVHGLKTCGRSLASKEIFTRFQLVVISAILMDFNRSSGFREILLSSVDFMCPRFGNPRTESCPERNL